MKKGDIVEGIVTRITNYGAFVDISGITGMIHISEISREFINDINERLKINQAVKAVVIETNKEGRLALSIKRLPENKPADKPVDFEDMLSKFKRDSDERIADLNLEAKKPPRVNKKNK